MDMMMMMMMMMMDSTTAAAVDESSVVCDARGSMCAYTRGSVQCVDPAMN